MDWYYAIKDQRCGPVPEPHLGALLHTGVITSDTLVWRAGLPEWRPLRTVLPALTELAAGDRMCAECRNYFPESEMLCLNHAWVCAQCKPRFLQRLLEGAMPVVGAGQMWRQGHLLVVHAETPFPDQCIRCNAPANGFRLRCQLQWAPTGRIVISPQRAVVHVGLCQRHRARRKWIFVGSWLAVLLGIGMFTFGRSLHGEWLIAGLLLGLAGILTAGHFSAAIAAAKIGDGVLWLRGAGEAFLTNFPDWTGDR